MMSTTSNGSSNNDVNHNAPPSLPPEIGSDGLPRESSVISYTERIIEEEQLQLRKYIEENYTKIRDVEKELTNLNLEMKLTAGPKKAALEHMRKKIEISTEKIRLAKLKEEQAQKAWEEASKAVKDEEAIKQNLCEDLNRLVQESNNTQFARLGELKRRLEALNPSRSSSSIPHDGSSVQSATAPVAALAPRSLETSIGSPASIPNHGNATVTNGQNQQPHVDGEGRKKKVVIQGRQKGVGAIAKSRGHAGPGWTGAGFE